jgi:hypothetical protein
MKLDYQIPPRLALIELAAANARTRRSTGRHLFPEAVVSLLDGALLSFRLTAEERALTSWWRPLDGISKERRPVREAVLNAVRNLE